VKKVSRTDCSTTHLILIIYPRVGKSGGTVDEAVDLCYFIHEYCPHLSLVGLMTIGAPGRQLAPGQVNPDFLVSSMYMILIGSLTYR
jgi:uncharacterized pyridoxal phosphate-containing UPF0001 family protein